jgi:riboflavin synthase alpha subunit
MEGHFVLGHVDGVGIIKKIEKKPKEIKVWFEIPKHLSRFVVQKGSIAIDGISLTVVDVKKNLASVCLIPHTVQVTNFQTRMIGDKVNIETDILSGNYSFFSKLYNYFKIIFYYEPSRCNIFTKTRRICVALRFWKS